ncbi:hypothetical protein [Phenylobacterium sp.]|uniref:hypothetical protein n=1 Tax=Phenylobacterium sp. TaxID=1871053 RepID=UPI002FCC2038
MLVYRVYIVRPDGRAELPEEFMCPEDDAARQRFAVLAEGVGEAELWQDGRPVELSDRKM